MGRAIPRSGMLLSSSSRPASQSLLCTTPRTQRDDTSVAAMSCSPSLLSMAVVRSRLMSAAWYLPSTRSHGCTRLLPCHFAPNPQGAVSARPVAGAVSHRGAPSSSIMWAASTKLSHIRYSSRMKLAVAFTFARRPSSPSSVSAFAAQPDTCQPSRAGLLEARPCPV